MTEPASYAVDDGIATLTLDDGKVNVLSPTMLEAINNGLDRALDDGAVLVISGRPGMFSAGFDLGVLRGGGDDAIGMVRGGFELAVRLLSFPQPVVIACTGHAVAMGTFLLLSADYRIGARGQFKFQANEVAIGLTLPRTAIEICRQRLAPSHFYRVTALSEAYSPDTAVEAGFLDAVVDAAEVGSTARGMAEHLKALDRGVHAEAKLRIREQALAAIRAGFDLDYTGLTG
jgi:enoyl-CoA hydratase